MKNIAKPLVLAIPLLVAACGGGGGSSGETNEHYSISLRADKSALPVNTGNASAGLGVYAPYTTTLYVSAKKGDNAIPGGDDIFACNVTAGLDSGALAYLDGDEKHQTDGVENLYRSVTLGSNAGAATFHLHALNKAGTATVTCAVTDPLDKKEYTASTTITVGGGSTNTPASIVNQWNSAGFAGALGPINSTNPKLRNNVVMNALVMNDNNQPVGNAGKQNVQVSIRSSSAAVGARLLAGGKSGTSLQISSDTTGIAQYSLSSGASVGVILLELVTDRSDNDVSNGIQDPIVTMVSVPVVNDIATEALAVDAAQLDDVTVTNGQAFVYALQATGGVPAYTWSAVAGLPSGMTLSSDGILQGTVRLTTPGVFHVTVKVTDANGSVVTQQVKLTVTGTLPADPVSLSIAGCSGGASTVCALPDGVTGNPYSYAFVASGGGTITWTFTGLPAWLQGSSAGNTGMVYSKKNMECTNTVAGTGGATTTDTTIGVPGPIYTFFVTAANSTNSVTRQVSVNVVPATTCP